MIVNVLLWLPLIVALGVQVLADGIRKLGRIEAKDAPKKKQPAPPPAKVTI